MKIIIRILTILISITLIVIVLKKVDFGTFIDIFKNVNIIYYSTGIILIFSTQFLFAYRWKITLPKNSEIKYFHLFYKTVTSYLFNNFFLGVLGGDFYKALGIHKDSGKLTAVTSVIYNRIINTYAATIFPVLFVPFLFNDIKENNFLLYSQIFSGICLFIFIIILFTKKQLINLIPLKYLNTERKAVLKDIDLSKTMLLSLMIQFINIYAHYVFALALNIEIDFFSLAVLYSASAVVISLPVSINGIGVREGIFIYAFSFWNISQESALAFSFLSFMSSIILSLIGGVLFLSENINKAKHGK